MMNTALTIALVVSVVLFNYFNVQLLKKIKLLDQKNKDLEMTKIYINKSLYWGDWKKITPPTYTFTQAVAVGTTINMRPYYTLFDELSERGIMMQNLQSNPTPEQWNE